MLSDLKQRFANGPGSIYDKLVTLVSEDMKARSIVRKVEPAQAEVCHEWHQSSTPHRAVQVQPPHEPFPVPETGVEGPPWFPFLLPLIRNILQEASGISATYDIDNDTVVTLFLR